MSAARLPAFGKEVLAQLAPEAPLCVWVSANWDARPRDAVCIARGWRPGLYAWERFGSRPARVAGDGSIPWVVVLAIAAEASDFLMPVTVAIGVVADDIDNWAFGNREARDGRFVWPVWWSDEREAFYQSRRSRFWERLVKEACHASLH